MIPLRLLPTATMRRKRLQPIIENEFRLHDLPVSWGLAFAYVESRFRPWVVNMDGGDGRRGGAWGLFQMTLRTAHGLGFPNNAEPSQLLDPSLNTYYAVELLRDLNRQYHNLRDVAAAYNSGKPFALAPESTRSTYVPNVEAWAAIYRGKDVDGA